ncbi:MAG: hypothetical protein EOM50_08735 [Erysipelotrichia bacterium]|nr:hypothetical protein [Erysipelotrichia bacterium]
MEQKSDFKLNNYIDKLVETQQEHHLNREAELKIQMIYLVIALVSGAIVSIVLYYNPYVLKELLTLLGLLVVGHFIINRYFIKRSEEMIRKAMLNKNGIVISHRVIQRNNLSYQTWYFIGLVCFMLMLLKGKGGILAIDYEYNLNSAIFALPILLFVMYFVNKKQKENDDILNYIGSTAHIKREKDKAIYFEHTLEDDTIHYSSPEFNDYCRDEEDNE